MPTKNGAAPAVRHALSAAVAEYKKPLCQAFVITTTFLWMHGAFAQTPSAAETEERQVKSSTELESVIVVGSRILQDTFNSPSPIQVIDREEATAAGFNTLTDLLQSTSVTSGAAQINSAYGGLVTRGGPGANTLSLRGLGATRTLVLINGRRVSPAGTRGAVGSADLNVLPTAMTREVQVLRDGASSIYGSDAIAGVVNVITLKNVEGFTLEGQYHHPLEGEGEQARFSIVGGFVGDAWEMSGSVEYYERANLTLADRDWTKCNMDLLRDPVTGASLDYIDPLTGRSKCYTITGTGSNGLTINTVGTQNVTAANAAGLGLSGPGVPAAGAVGTTFNRWRPNSGVTTGVVGFEGVGGGTTGLNVRDTFDPRMLNRNLILPTKSLTGFLQGTYQLEALGDAELYAELLANERKSEQTGYRSMTVDYRLTSTPNPLIPANLRFSNFGPDEGAGGTTGGARIAVRAFVGFGNDFSSQDIEFMKPTIGLRGKFALPFADDDWRYDVMATYAKSTGEYHQQSFLIDKMRESTNVVAAPVGFDATLVRNGLTCAINLTNPAERCILSPPLTTATVSGALPDDYRNYIFRDIVGNTDYDETIVSATVDGSVYDLPAGSIKAVLGLEYRDSEIDDSPDPNSVANNLLNQTSATPTRGSDSVIEAYTEFQFPILSELPGADLLTLMTSFRFTDYDSYGSDETYKFGVAYKPIEWVTLRYSRGTSFRAPALFEQFQGPTSGFFNQSNDPCNNYGASPNPVRVANCAAELPGNPTFNATQSVLALSVGGAGHLEAETSDHETAGITFRPPLGDHVGDVAIAIDYFDIEINNGVEQRGALNILPLCYDDPQFRAGGAYCRLVTRNPGNAQLTVSNEFTNISTQIVKGVDYTFRYERPVGPGSVRVNALLTRYITQATQLFPGDPLKEANGSQNNPKWSGDGGVDYTLGKWRFHYGIEWIDGMDSYAFRAQNQATSNFDLDVEDYYEHSASVRYTEGDWQAVLGVRNLTNEEPPTMSQGFYTRVGNSPIYSGYDYVGREAFVFVTKRFK